MYLVKIYYFTKSYIESREIKTHILYNLLSFQALKFILGPGANALDGELDYVPPDKF